MKIEYENLNLLNKPFEQKFHEVFQEMLNKGRYILGDQVEAFEQEFACFCKASHFVGVGTGTDAIYLALKALDLPRDSEVILPSNCYIAALLAVLNAGLKPVLVEPILETYTIDPDGIEKVISKKTKVLLVVHLYGLPCDMERIVAIAQAHKLHLVEDCAQAHGAYSHNKMVGTYGIGAFSFYPTKNLGALGDAGGIAVASEDMAKKLRALRNYGFVEKFKSVYRGVNSRMDELQAAFLRIKLPHLNEINNHKRHLAEFYCKKLNRQFVLPQKECQSRGEIRVYHIFPIRHPRRDHLQQYLREQGIQTAIHYPIPPHKHPCLRSLFRQSYPISEEIHRTVLSLPISVIHSEQDVVHIAEVCNQF